MFVPENRFARIRFSKYCLPCAANTCIFQHVDWRVLASAAAPKLGNIEKAAICGSIVEASPQPTQSTTESMSHTHTPCPVVPLCSRKTNANASPSSRLQQCERGRRCPCILNEAVCATYDINSVRCTVVCRHFAAVHSHSSVLEHSIKLAELQRDRKQVREWSIKIATLSGKYASAHMLADNQNAAFMLVRITCQF